MPTIIIRNGARSLKFTKRERDTLMAARAILGDVAGDYLGDTDENLAIDIEAAREMITTILSLENVAAKPAPADTKPKPKIANAG